MEFSQVFGFLKIVKESIKVVSKNGKLMASITTFTLVPPSLLLVLVVYFHKFLTKKVDKAILEYLWSDTGYTPKQIIAYGIQFCSSSARHNPLRTHYFHSFLHFSNISSFTDLLSQIKATCTRLLTPSYFRSRRPRKRITTVAAALALPTCYPVIYYPNAITFGIGIVVVITLVVLGLHASVITMLAAVISVVEENRWRKRKLKRLLQGIDLMVS